MTIESTSKLPANGGALKRSLFNRPSWSKPQNLGSPADLFHRSNQTYVDIAAEAERKRKKKLAKKEGERVRSGVIEERAGKRRRISGESEDDNDDSSSDEACSHSEGLQDNAVRPIVQAERTIMPISPVERGASPKSLSKHYETTIPTKQEEPKPRSYPADVIDLEDEENDSKPQQDEGLRVTSIKPPQPPPEDDDFPASDEEFSELARKARERARRKRLEADIAFSTPDPIPSASGHGSLHRSHSGQQATPPPPPPDPVIQILITSSITNTEPLIVARKVVQRLKDVRVIWCERQGFSREFMNTVFLTWRGKRLFDVTTCKSLGIAVDADGNVLTKGQKDIFGEEDRQIHMEAMTEEILEEYNKAKRRGEVDGEEEDAASSGVAPIVQEQEAQVRIILKAKDLDDFRLKVKTVSLAGWTSCSQSSNNMLQSTLISKIVNAFRSTNKIDLEREVFLSFDGERLSPKVKVGETELSDMDHVDVYIK